MYDRRIKGLFIIIAVLLLVGFGVTLAYFTSTTNFDNLFQTALYQTEATETFTSPDNWMPGDTTPKELTITNTGNVDVKARVCLEEEWESENGDTLPLKQNGNRAAIINLANTSDWTYRLGCYEYNDTLEPNDETSSFIESVTFNPLIEADITCITNGNTKTCTSSGDGYDNATYTLTFTVETIQASAYDELWKPIRYVNRQLEGEITVGDEVRIDTEHFYVVSSNQNETVLLSKYNLLVGDVWNYEYDEVNDSQIYTLNKTLSSSDTGYGLQNSTARGWVDLESGETTTRLIGTVPFSGTNYWDNSVCEYTGTNSSCTGTEGLLSEYSQNGETYWSNPHNTNYPYVYRNNIENSIVPNIVYHPTYGYGAVQNNGYTIAYYVENYINTLKALGAPSTINGRLLSQEEATSLGCSGSDHYCSPVDDINNPTNGTAASWVYSTSYWLGSAYDNLSLWVARSGGNFYSDIFNDDNYYGVRPVIVINTSDL